MKLFVWVSLFLANFAFAGDVCNRMQTRLGTLISAESAVPSMGPGVVHLNDPSLGLGEIDQKRDCRIAHLAMITALNRLAASGGGILHIPAGKYCVDFDIADQNNPDTPYTNPKDQTHELQYIAGKRLHNLGSLVGGVYPDRPEKLLKVPARTKIIGDLDPVTGQIASVLIYKNSAFPFLNFVKSDQSGLYQLELRYSGINPTQFPFTLPQIHAVLGTTASSTGTQDTVASAIYAIESQSLTFKKLVFSHSHLGDNAYSYAFGIVARGTQPLSGADSCIAGLGGYASGFVFEDLQFKGGVNPILASGLMQARFKRISQIQRGSWAGPYNLPVPLPQNQNPDDYENWGKPGHVIYMTTQYQYGRDATTRACVPLSSMRNRDLAIDTIWEDGQAMKLDRSLGTLALKSTESVWTRKIVTAHPIGLLHSMFDSKDVCMNQLDWSSTRGDFDTCATCDTNVIRFTVREHLSREDHFAYDRKPNENIEISDVSLAAPNRAIQIEGGTMKGDQIPKNYLFERWNLTYRPMLSALPSSNESVIRLSGDQIKLFDIHYRPQLAVGEKCTHDRQTLQAFYGIPKGLEEGSIEFHTTFHDADRMYIDCFRSQTGRCTFPRCIWDGQRD